MKTITTTREYDAEGRLVKETVCEIVTQDAAPYVPHTCTCGASTLCPVHGYRVTYPGVVWYSRGEAQGVSQISGSEQTFNGSLS